jgi:hypothetical protein
VLTDVKIVWEYPDDNRDQVLAYKIEIRTSDLITFSETTECDGLIIHSRECLV